MTTTEIRNPDGDDPITHINVMRVFTYDVAEIVRTLHEDNRDTGYELEITYEDVLEYIDTLAEDDFRSNGIKDLVYTDQYGNGL